MTSLPRHRRTDRAAVAIWLFAVSALLFVMIIVGGVTRLTESGLSMVEWRPVTGWLPPLSTEAWQAEFDKYRNFPEYREVNRGMSLDEFRVIYGWEFAHRLLGRIIGLAFFVPLVFFIVTRRLGGRETLWLLFLLALGGGQGALGWYMVQSGLVDRPDVSHYRLAMHLGLAFVIFAFLWLTGLKFRAETRPPPSPPSLSSAPPGRGLRAPAMALTGLVFLQVLIGAFVAGTNAGHAYNSWPDMDGDLIPPVLLTASGSAAALFDDIAAIQFAHRMTAYLIVGVAIWLYLRFRALGRPWLGLVVMQVTLLQTALGVITLLMAVPLALGALHQALAVMLWASALTALRAGWAPER